MLALIRIYNQFHFHKKIMATLIILTITLSFFFLYNIDIQGIKIRYLSYYRSYHNNYFYQNLLLINITNIFFIISVLSFEVDKRVINFDKMFLANLSRKKVVTAKLLSYFKIIFIFWVLQTLVELIIALIFYKYLWIEKVIIKIKLYTLLFNIFCFLIAYLVIFITKNIFSSFILIIFYFNLNINSQIYSLKDFKKFHYILSLFNFSYIIEKAEIINFDFFYHWYYFLFIIIALYESIIMASYLKKIN